MISYKNNFIFVHIPKCAGTSIEQYFAEMEGSYSPCKLLLPSNRACRSHRQHILPFEVKQHYTLQSIRDILYSRGEKEFYDNAFKFAVVRNPWDRIVSDAIYLKDSPWGDFLPDCNTPHEAITKLGNIRNVKNHRFDINQIDFLKVDGKVDVDYIIKFEDLNQGFKEVLEKLELPTNKKLGHAMPTKHKNYAEYYTEETKALIGERYKKDVEYFGYEFEEGGKKELSGAEDLTIIIKTLLRPESLDACIKSIHQTCGTGVKIFVGDDSPSKTIKLRKDVERYFILPEDSGLAYGRNFMEARVKTKYLMLIDDDTVFLPETKDHIEEAISILDNHNNIDLVGGREKNVAWYGSLKIENNKIILDFGVSIKTVDGYPLYDFVPNIFIARTDKIIPLQWDDELKVCEHTEFFWRAKGKLNSTFLPHFIVINSHVRNKTYSKFRNRGKHFCNLQYKKMGIENKQLRFDNKIIDWNKLKLLTKKKML